MNRGVLKPKEPFKYTEPVRTNKVEKKEKDLLNMNRVENREKRDGVNRFKPVPGGTNYVPSKDTKKYVSKPKEIVNNKLKEKEPKEFESQTVKEKEELVKEDSFTENGEWTVRCNRACLLLV